MVLRLFGCRYNDSHHNYSNKIEYGIKNLANEHWEVLYNIFIFFTFEFDARNVMI
jgi:hypothetical protein